MESKSIDTGCKINLFLRVTGRRDDGYHTLETLFLPLERPGDTITVEFGSAGGIRFETDGRVPRGADNLVCRAAELYAAETGVSPAWSIRLEKRIPVAAGLGGGSADAAATLRLLEDYYRAAGPGRLRDMALRLGADVPFFLAPVPSVAHGVGEKLTPLERRLPPLHLVLVNPGFPVSARWAYGRLPEGRRGSGTLSGLLEALEKREWRGVAENIRNDLAAALWKKFPLLAVLKAGLEAHDAFAVEVSGSGPTLYALFPERAAAERAAAQLAASYPMFKVFAVEA